MYPKSQLDVMNDKRGRSGEGPLTLALVVGPFKKHHFVKHFKGIWERDPNSRGIIQRMTKGHALATLFGVGVYVCDEIVLRSIRPS